MQAISTLVNEGWLDLYTIDRLPWHCCWVADLYRAAAVLQRPMLPHCPRRSTLPSIPVQIKSDAHVSACRNLRYLPPPCYLSQGEYIHIFDELHQLGLAMQRPEADYLAFISPTYSVMQRLCHVIAAIEEQGRTDLSLDEAVLLCAQLTIFGFNRHYILTRHILGVLVDRLYRGLLHREDLVEVWQHTCGLESLLWVLFVTNAAAFTADLTLCNGGSAMQKRLLETLEQVVSRLGIMEFKDYTNILRTFPWTDHLHADRAAVLWTCISGLEVEMPLVDMFVENVESSDIY